MSETFDQLVNEIREEYKKHMGPWNASAKDYIPRLWDALADEPNKVERRRIVESVGVADGGWAIKTIRDALPAEAKDANQAKIGKKTKSIYKASNLEAEKSAPQITNSGEVYKGDAGNDPALLKKYVEPEPLSSIERQILNHQEETTRRIEEKDAKIAELQRMVKVLSAVPNAGKMADLEQENRGLKYEIEQLSQGLEGKPLTTAKQELTDTTAIEVPANLIGSIVAAFQKGTREKKSVSLLVKNGVVVGVEA